MRIEKKVWPEYFREIIEGKKTFELRLNDFAIKEGDTIVLKEWDPNSESYTGRIIKKVAGYIGRWKIDDLTKFWSKKEIEERGLQVISLKDK